MSLEALPRDVSLHGHRIDRLIHESLLLAALLFAAVVVWMAASLILRRRPLPAPASVLGTLGIAAFVFLVVDGNLLVRSARESRAQAPPGALRVEVNARQWLWSFRSAGPDGAFATPDDAVSTELVIPVDTPVALQLGSADVVHALYLPNLRVKIDAIPGSLTRVWFQARETGDFDLGCAQHCGAGHYLMRGGVRVLSVEDYARWAERASRVAASAHDPAADWGWPWPD